MSKTDHQKRIEEFMALAGQEVPNSPVIPSEETRLLRAKLIMEEALETIEALGVSVFARDQRANMYIDIVEEDVGFRIDGQCDIVEVVDGCIDVSVVTMGTLSAFGVPDKIFKEAIDQNNLDKFGEGHYVRDDGKLVKPPGHKAPDILGMLKNLGYQSE